MISAGAVIFRRIHGSIQYLVLRAYNYWDFPKGKKESHDFDTIETAKREIQEESSLSHIAFVVKNGKKLFIETEPYGKQKKIARYYLCYVSYKDSLNVSLKINPELGKPEHDEFRWVTHQEAHILLNNRLRKVLTWANEIIAESL